MRSIIDQFPALPIQISLLFQSWIRVRHILPGRSRSFKYGYFRKCNKTTNIQVGNLIFNTTDSRNSKLGRNVQWIKDLKKNTEPWL